jgi:hypothetical protein
MNLVVLIAEDGEETLIYLDQVAFIEKRADGTGKASTTGGDINLDVAQMQQLGECMKAIIARDPDYEMIIKEC